MIALSVNRLSQTSTIAYITAWLSLRDTFKIESNSPAPAIFFKSSSVELDLTATRLANETF